MQGRIDRIVAVSSLALVGVLLLSVWACGAGVPASPGSQVVTFSGPVPEIPRHDPNIQYDLDPSRERYFLFVPAGYTGREPYGLIVYTSPGDEMKELPSGWQAVLQRRKLLLLAAQSAGNDQDSARRCGLAVLGAAMAKRDFKIDPQRVYAAGFSGGARTAGRLGLYQPDIFHGTIQSCGADFYEEVPKTHPVPEKVKALGGYGLLKATQEEIDLSKSSVRYVFVTGSKDFRYADIQNIYEGGFAKAGFKAKLIDVAGMDHEDCGPKALMQALDFIEGGQNASAPSAASAPAAPAWIALPTNRWPQMLMELDILAKDKTQVTGASGFLVRMPNGAVVASTAKHAACDKTSVDAFATSFVSFTMHPRTNAERKVSLVKPAISAADADKLDCLLMTVPPQTWPVEVRPARSTPAQEGETVYLVAVPYNEHTAQNVYKGTVRRCEGDHEFLYDFGDKADAGGFSGAPVLDANGNVVGMHLGRTTLSDGTIFRRAVNLSSVVPACTAPGIARPAPKSASSQPARTPTWVPANSATGRPSPTVSGPAR